MKNLLSKLETRYIFISLLSAVITLTFLFILQATNPIAEYKGIIFKNNECRLVNNSKLGLIECYKNAIFETIENENYNESSYALNYLCSKHGNQDACRFLDPSTSKVKFIIDKFPPYSFLDLESLCNKSSFESFVETEFYCSKLKQVAYTLGDMSLYSEISQFQCKNKMNEECFNTVNYNSTFSLKTNYLFKDRFCSTKTSNNKYCNELNRTIGIQEKFEKVFLNSDFLKNDFEVKDLMVECFKNKDICEKIINDISNLNRFIESDVNDYFLSFLTTFNPELSSISGETLKKKYPIDELIKLKSLENQILALGLNKDLNSKKNRLNETRLNENCNLGRNIKGCSNLFATTGEAKKNISNLRSFCKAGDQSSCKLLQIIKNTNLLNSNLSTRELILDGDIALFMELQRSIIVEFRNKMSEFLLTFKNHILTSIVILLFSTQVLMIFLMLQSSRHARNSRELMQKASDLNKKMLEAQLWISEANVKSKEIKLKQEDFEKYVDDNNEKLKKSLKELSDKTKEIEKALTESILSNIRKEVDKWK